MVLGVISLEQIKNWESIEGIYKWITGNFTDSNYPLYANHFRFDFETKNHSDLFNFLFSLLSKKEELKQFVMKVLKW